jgi:hypothetical protein
VCSINKCPARLAADQHPLAKIPKTTFQIDFSDARLQMVQSSPNLIDPIGPPSHYQGLTYVGPPNRRNASFDPNYARHNPPTRRGATQDERLTPLMSLLPLIALLLALILFGLAMFNINGAPRFQFVPAGLFCLVLYFVLTQVVGAAPHVY